MRMLHLGFVAAASAAAVPAAVGAPVTLQNATATLTQGGFAVGGTIDGNLGGTSVVNGWALDNGQGAAASETAVFETLADVGGAAGATYTFTLTQNFGTSLTLGKFRLSVTTDARTAFADGLNNGGDVTANWVQLTPQTAVATNGATLTIQGDNTVLAGGPNPATSVYTITASTPVTNVTGIRLEALEDPSLGVSLGPGRSGTGNGNLVLHEFAVDAVSIVPEPAGAALLTAAAGIVLSRGRRSQRGRGPKENDLTR